VKRTRKIILISTLLVAALLGTVVYSGVKNKQAQTIKPLIQKEVSQWLNTAEADDQKKLGEVAGIRWDLVCVPNHYSSGVKAVKRYFRDVPINLSGFSIADETLFDAEYGLAFVSLKSKLLITVPVDSYVQFNAGVGKNFVGCLSGDRANLSRPRPASSEGKGSVYFIEAPTP
jgi:hypothetical protein